VSGVSPHERDARIGTLLAELGALLREEDGIHRAERPLAEPAYFHAASVLMNGHRSDESAIRLAHHLAECVNSALRLLAFVTMPEAYDAGAVESVARDMVADAGWHLREIAKALPMLWPE